jgi:hypothetical protein
MSRASDLAQDAANVLMAVPEDAELDSHYLDAYVYVDPDNTDNVLASMYLGTTMGLDPCGRLHHMLSPNGVTDECVTFWEDLESELEERGLFLFGDEGDGCVYHVGRVLRDTTDDERERQAA